MHNRSRSRPFAVKDLKAFTTFLTEVHDLLTDIDRAGIVHVAILDKNEGIVRISAYGDWPTEEYDLGNEELAGLDFFNQLAGHLLDGHCAVLESFDDPQNHFELIIINQDGIQYQQTNQDLIAELVNRWGGNDEINAQE